jgi:uncharacterized protein
VISRNVTRVVLEALATRPVVLLHGGRQVGKSTLAQALASGPHRAEYVTLDDAAVLAAAHVDPMGFISRFSGPVVLDEIQRAPELLRAIKTSVDRDRRPGRFLLTGSANVLFLPRVSDTLAGRMEIHTLWPLSQGEIDGRRESFVDAAFAEGALSHSIVAEPWSRLLERVLRGGYPEVVTGGAASRHHAWFGSYVTTILQREVREIANIDALTAMPRLLVLLGTRAGSLLNVADLSRGIGIPITTLRRYLALLETTFLTHMLPAWAANVGKRLTKAAKVLLTDTGLMAHLLGVDAAQLARDPTRAGPLLESFVAMEIRKQVGWSKAPPLLLHFRTSAGHEVDLVMEVGTRLVGIEVKAAATINEHDFRGLRLLAEATGKRFHRGIVLYAGSQSLPFGPKLSALPISALWRLGAAA